MKEHREAAFDEREIRHMLRTLRRPKDLAALPLSATVCTITGMSNPLEAAKALILSALPGSSEAGEMHRRIVWEGDVEGYRTQSQLAGDLALSPRQFFRYRAQAVSAITHHVNRLASGPQLCGGPLRLLPQLVGRVNPRTGTMLQSLLCGEPISRNIDDMLFAGPPREAQTELDGAVPVALELLERGRIADVQSWIDRARDRVTATKLGEQAAYQVGLVQSMLDCYTGRICSTQGCDARTATTGPIATLRARRRIAQGRLDEAATLLAAIEMDASERADVLLLATCSLLRAQAAFVRADYRRAELLAFAAFLSLRQFGSDAREARAFLVRIAVFTGTRRALVDIPASAPRFANTELAARSRMLMLDGRVQEAFALCEVVEKRLQRAPLHSVQAYNAATRAALLRQSPSRAQVFLAQADNALSTHDTLFCLQARQDDNNGRLSA